MKTQLRTIVLAVPLLSKIVARDLSLRLAYQLKKNIFALQTEVDFFAEQRQKLFQKYGTAKDDGTYSFEGENEQKAIAELDELLDLEVSPEAEPLDIPISENLCIAVNDMDLLMPFIHFTED